MFRTVSEAVATAFFTAELNESGELPTSSMTLTTSAMSSSSWGTTSGPPPYPAAVPLPLLEPMLATSSRPSEAHRWAIEPKLDGRRAAGGGRRALVYVDGGVRVRTRR